MKLFNLCETAGFLRVLLFLKYFIRIIFIVLPIILIITMIIKIAKIVLSGKQDELKALLPDFIKRVIAALIIFFVPNIVKFVMSMVTDQMAYIDTCLDKATVENIKYYQKLEPVKLALDAATANPTKSNVDKAEKLVEEAKGIANGDTLTNYYIQLAEAQNKVNAIQDYQECTSKGGTYSDGYCTLPPDVHITIDDPSSNGSGSGGDSGPISAGDTSGSKAPVVDYNNAFNNEYRYINTKMSVSNYADFVKKNGITQDSNTGVYGDKCLAFAYIHAYSMYSGDTSARAKDSLDWMYAYKFKSYESDSKSDFLSKVYNEIMKGRPVIVQVNGRLDSNGNAVTRHYVTVVGFKKTVKNASSLKDTDLLIMDSWDGRVERMDEKNSRFLVSGAQIHYNYTGYQMFYLR